MILLLAFAFGPTLLGYETMIVTSGSMGHAMPVGSVAQTKLAPARSIAVGDIVSFRLPTAKTSTTHRVIAVNEATGSLVLTTKGDANPAADAVPVIIKTGESIQRVERIVPYAGNIVRAARGPAGVVTLFAIPILGLTFDRRKRTARTKTERVTPLPVATPTLTVAFASTVSTSYGRFGPVDARKAPPKSHRPGRSRRSTA